MTRTAESGAYLGGIGTMLTQTEVCSSCGRIHSGRRFGFLGSTRGECPLVVVGSLPIMATDGEDDPATASTPLPELPPLRSGPDLGTPVPLPTGGARKGSGMNIPWPMPSHLEDFL